MGDEAGVLDAQDALDILTRVRAHDGEFDPGLGKPLQDFGNAWVKVETELCGSVSLVWTPCN